MKLLNKHIKTLSYLVLLSFVSCYSIEKLPDRWTTITHDERVYNNRQKFSSSITNLIDTNSIYEECCYKQILDSSFFGLNKQKRYISYSYGSDSYKNYYRFYGNGFCNYFSVKNSENELEVANFDPKLTGFRGVYYLDKNGNIKLDLFTQTGQLGSLRSSYGLRIEKVTISGDSLLFEKENKNTFKVYIKRKATTNIQQIRGW